MRVFLYKSIPMFTLPTFSRLSYVANRVEFHAALRLGVSVTTGIFALVTELAAPPAVATYIIGDHEDT